MVCAINPNNSVWPLTQSLLPKSEDSSDKTMLKVAFLIVTLAVPLLIAAIADLIQACLTSSKSLDGPIWVKLETNSNITTSPADFIVNAANPVMLGGGGVDGAISRAGGVKLLLDRYLAPAENIDGNPIRCPVGNAVRTDAGNLPASYCIHAVGPNCQEGYDMSETHLHDKLLQKTYRATLASAHQTLEAIARGDRLYQTEQELNDILYDRRDIPLPNLDQEEPGLIKHLARSQKAHYETLKGKIDREEPISISFPTLCTGIYAFPMKRAAQIAIETFNEYIEAHENDPVRLSEIRVVFIPGQLDVQFYSS